MIYKSTLFFISLTFVFATLTGFVIWKLVESPQGDKTNNTSIDVSIPGIATDDSKKEISAKSAILWDQKTGVVLFEQNAFEKMPIASITKLMTAMVALDYGISWNKPCDILPDEYLQGGNLILHQGERVTMRDLFSASLLGSANNATLAYVRALGINEKEFVRQMNRKAIEMGLEQTHFIEPTGLNPDNTSTAYDVAQIAAEAFNKYPEISKITSQKEYTFNVEGTDREHTIQNTNKLISQEKIQFTGSKTGYLYEAGYCLVVQKTTNNTNLIGVILNSPSKPWHFASMKKLINLPVP